MRLKNLNRIIIATLNINSIRNKFDQLILSIKDNIDVLVLTETKLDDTFPTSQFMISGFSKPYRRDRNKNGGGILIYVRDSIPSKELSNHNLPDDIESIFVELNFRKSKWLLMGTYHPPSQSDSYFFNKVSNSLDMYISKYENVLLTGDFNSEDTEPDMLDFLERHNAKNIQHEHTCFKSTEAPTCIDLFITNKPMSFQNTTVLTNGLSDFHKMAITVFKTTFHKNKPKEVTYRDYKNFNKDLFKNDLRKSFSDGCKTYDKFEDVFLCTLNNHAPLKTKLIRANHAPYMTKCLRKAIMRRSQLQSKYFKTKTKSDYDSFKRQRNYASKLYKKEKKNFYKKLDLNFLLDNKKFWKYMKPICSEKTECKPRITLVDGENIISDDLILAETFNTFFKEAVKNLDIKENNDIINMEIDIENCTDPLDMIIQKFDKHPSILKINEMVHKNHNFHFKEISLEDVELEIKMLNAKKATTFKNIPSQRLKDSAEVCCPVLLQLVNNCFIDGEFPKKLKVADVTPVYKKDNATNVKNYRPISILPATSKIFERLIQKQIADFMENKLSPILCGYRKGFSTQHALILLLEKWRSILDKKGYAGAVLMDLSKAFDCLNHELLLAKLHAYGFSMNSLRLIKSYLENRWQRTKINTSFSSWYELLKGVPQGSVLGPLLFNIYINDLFWINEETDVCNFADDTTLYACDMNLDTVLNKLEHDALLVIEWFEANYMKLNTDKCHLLVAGHKHEWVWAKIGNEIIWESNEEKLLGINIDRKLNFEKHIASICKKANNKLTAIARYKKFLTFEKTKTLITAFVTSQFEYCPLVWMFHSRKVNSKINRLHERALRLLYSDDTSSFEQLLNKSGMMTIHQRNIQSLAIEMFKVKIDIGPQLLSQIFIKRKYNGPALRNGSDFVKPKITTVHFGENSLRAFGNNIWNKIPCGIRNLQSLDNFKMKIKDWTPPCDCKLCKEYVVGVGFI